MSSRRTRNTEAVVVETVVVKLVEGTVVVSVVVIGCVVLVVNVTAVDKKLLYYTYFDALTKFYCFCFHNFLT